MKMIYPMFVMVLLIVVVAGLNLTWRIRAVKQRKVSARYFKLYSSETSEVPDYLLAGARNFSNLFEFPMLFLLTCVLVLSLGLQSVAFVVLAWVFVLSRVLHSIIHMSYNHIIHRLLAFKVGVLSVFIMWLILLVKLS